MTRTGSLVWGLVCLVLAGATEVWAQGPDPIFDARGINQNRAYFGQLPFENIDATSGALVLTFTDLVLPGNAGSELRFQRTYNSKPSDPARHWTFGLAGMVMEIRYNGPPPETLWPNPPDARPFPDPVDAAYRPTLYRADGGVQPTIWMQKPVIHDPTSYRWVTTSDFLRYDTVERRLYLPDGTVCQYGDQISDRTVKLEEIRDPFGNVTLLDWDQDGHLVTVAQHLSNTQVRVVAFTPSNPLVVEEHLPATMTFDGHQWTYAYDDGLLVAATGPVGPGWAYEYSGGTMAVTTPQGGRTEYDFADHAFPDYSLPPPSEPSLHISPVVTARRTLGRLPAGTWSYSYDNDNQRTTITGPGGVVTTVTYEFRSGGLLTSLNAGLVPIARTVRQGNAVLEHETSEYTELDVVPGLLGGLPTLTRKRVKRGAAGDQSKTTYETVYEYRGFNDHFSDYHRPITIRESGDKSRVITRSYTYNLQSNILGKLASETVADGSDSFTKTWTYDTSTGFMTAASVYGVGTSYGRDGAGNVTSVTSASGTTGYEYEWGVPSAIITPKYRVDRTIRRDGAITAQTEAGRTTTYTYDGLLRPVSVAAPLVLVATTSYDNSGGAWVRIEHGTTWSRTDVDGAGRFVGSIDATGAQTETKYDADGRAIEQSLPFDAQHPKQVIKNTFDGLGRLIEKKHPDQSRIAYDYDGINVTITDEENRVTKQYFEGFGSPANARLVTVVDADNKRWEYRYNVLGQLTRVIAPDGNSNTVREWAYNSKAQVTSERHPESGTTTYQYDGSGNVTVKTDGAGVRLDFEYDGNDRLTRVSGPNGQWVRIEYETLGGTSGSDRRTFISRGGQVTSQFSYDLAGRLSWREDVIHGSRFRTEQDYDDLGNIDELTYPDQRLIKYRYDRANRITRIEDLSNGTQTYASDFKYHPSGALESYRSGNGVATTIDYDPERLWPSSIKATLPTPGAVGLSLDYRYDRVGNISGITEPARGGLGYSQAFEYDQVDRLKRADGVYGSQLFTYDAHGTQLAPNRTYDFNKLRLTSDAGATFGYDNAGRLTSRLTETFAYNMTGMMTRVVLPDRTVDYDYDADELRKMRRETVGGVEERSFFVHGLGGQLLGEFQQRGAGATVHALRDYIYAGSRLIAVAKPRRRSIEFTAKTQRIDEPTNPANPTDPGIPRPGGVDLVLRLPGGGTLAHNVDVTYAITGGLSTDGRATRDKDYRVPVATGTVRFLAGSADEARLQIPFEILHDRKDEADETFDVTITDVSDPDLSIGSTSMQTVTIVDNDEPPVVSLSADITVRENSGKARLTVSLSEASGRTVSVNWFTTPGFSTQCEYFKTAAQTLTFTEDVTSQFIEVDLVDNAKGNEPQKWFSVNLDTPVHTTLGRAQAIVRVDDDPVEAVTGLAWPGTYLASVRGRDRLDYVLVGNPYGRSVQATITTVFDNGSAWRHTTTLAPFARYTFDLGGPETACEVGASVAVQVQNGDVLGIEHAGYMGSAGGLSTEGTRPAPEWYFPEGHTGFGKEMVDVFNPNTVPVTVSISLHGPNGLLLIPSSYVMPALSRGQWPLNHLYPSIPHGIVVRGTMNGGAAANIVAARTILADSQLEWKHSTDGHVSSGISNPGAVSYLAEGHHGGALATFLTLLSASDTPTKVVVSYIHENGSIYNTEHDLPARARITVAPEPSMPGGGFGYRIKTTPEVPFAAERVMYTLPSFSAGHSGVATQTMSGVREFAEGATVQFETHFLVSNPSETEAAGVAFEFYDQAGILYLRHEGQVPAKSRRDFNVSSLPGMEGRIFHTTVSSTVPVVTERVSYWPSRALLSTFSTMLLPFTPSASLLAMPREWTPPAGGVPSVSPYTLAPATRIGPEWSAENLAAAQTVPVPSLRVMTSLASGDAWLAAHLSGGWEVSATPRLGRVSLTTSSSTIIEGDNAVVSVRVATADGAALSRGVTVMYTTATGTGEHPATPGTDFTATTGSVFFPVGWASGASKTVSIPTRIDARREFTETFRVVLTSVDGGGILDAPTTHEVLLVDRNLDPEISVNDISGAEGFGLYFFTVSLSIPSDHWVAVTATTRQDTAISGLDFDHATAAVTFPPGTTAVTFIVPIREDLVSEPSERFFVDLSAPVHSTIARAHGTGTIADNEPPRAPLNTAFPGQYFPDVTVSPDTSAYIMISNPHPVAVTARVTFTRPNASGLTRDVVVPASRRQTIDLSAEPDIAGQGDVSVAVQTTNALYPLVAETSQYWQADWRGGRSTHGGTPSSTYFFAEGAANAFFEEYLTIYNVTSAPTDITLTLIQLSGGLRRFTYRMNEGPARLKIRVNDLVTDTGHGTVIEARTLSGGAGAVVAERTMYWAGGDRREGHSANGSVARANTWYFAEGASGPFATYVALASYEPVDSYVVVRYFHENGVVYEQPATIPSNTRITLEPPVGMPAGGFGISVATTNNVPFIAERTMYHGSTWKVGASETGSSTLSTRWHFAEGASNTFFATWLLLFNPSTTAATGTLTFRLENGQVVTYPFTVAGRNRISIPLVTLSGLTWQTFSTEVAVTNGVPIVAERAMYWPIAWSASHTSIGRAW